MTGKLVFDKYYKFILILVKINSVFPKDFNKMLLTLIRNLPGKFGILLRYVLLKNICQNVGKNVIVFEGVVFDAPEMMSFGNNVSLNPYCYLAGDIHIGNDVSVAHSSAFHSYNHTWNNASLPIRNNELYSLKIIVENDVWIGCHCIVLSGVRISSRSVIAAGAVVTKTYPANSLIGGNPARVIKCI